MTQRVIRYSRLVGVLSFCWFAAAVIRAEPASEQDTNEPPANAASVRAARSGMALPDLIAAAGLRSERAVVVTLAGYDDAQAAGSARLVGDVKIAGPVDLRLGLAYVPGVGVGENKFQPHLGVRLRLLTQEDHGIDLATAIVYRLDRYSQDAGLLQGVVALGRRLDRLGLFANVAYGQDPEADDLDVDFTLAALYEAAQPLQIGLHSHLRVDFFSTDPRRPLRAASALDLHAGPVIHYSVGPTILLIQTGLSAIKVNDMRLGAFVLGGLGAAY